MLRRAYCSQISLIEVPPNLKRNFFIAYSNINIQKGFIKSHATLQVRKCSLLASDAENVLLISVRLYPELTDFNSLLIANPIACFCQ